MQIASKGDNLHEMSKHIFWEKREKNIISLSSAEFAQRVIEVKYQSRFMNAFICHKIKKVISFYSSNWSNDIIDYIYIQNDLSINA